jgi:hypothetical protein
VPRGSSKERKKAFLAGMEVAPARWTNTARGGGVGGEAGEGDGDPDESEASRSVFRSILFVSLF